MQSHSQSVSDAKKRRSHNCINYKLCEMNKLQQFFFQPREVCGKINSQMHTTTHVYCYQADLSTRLGKNQSSKNLFQEAVNYKIQK